MDSYASKAFQMVINLLLLSGIKAEPKANKRITEHQGLGIT